MDIRENLKLNMILILFTKHWLQFVWHFNLLMYPYLKPIHIHFAQLSLVHIYALATLVHACGNVLFILYNK